MNARFTKARYGAKEGLKSGGYHKPQSLTPSLFLDAGTRGINIRDGGQFDSYGVSDKVQNGETVDVRIEIDIDSISGDDDAALAHELGHAVQYLTGQASLKDPPIENEPTRIGNEAMISSGVNYTTNTYYGTSVPGWNTYVPWETLPAKSL